MTTDELRIEYAKQKEREGFAEIVKEYTRVKKLIADAGDLTHDEVVEIALAALIANGRFNLNPVRGRGVGI